jgi:hypothetical protein
MVPVHWLMVSFLGFCASIAAVTSLLRCAARAHKPCVCVPLLYTAQDVNK